MLTCKNDFGSKGKYLLIYRDGLKETKLNGYIHLII